MSTEYRKTDALIEVAKRLGVELVDAPIEWPGPFSFATVYAMNSVFMAAENVVIDLKPSRDGGWS